MDKPFFFVDDSGSKDWETPYAHEFILKPPARINENIKFWRGNYFVLAGIYVSTEAVARINPEIDALKHEYFGTKHVEIKSEWLRIPIKRRKKYLEPFAITEETLKRFVENAWYSLFEKNRESIQIQAFIIDKRFYNAKRTKVTPFQELAQVLFDRVELHPNSGAEIVFDQMEESIKSQKHDHGTLLRISKRDLNLGSYQKKYSHACVRFEKSCNSNFLQLADTVAYNIFRQFVQHGDSWESPEGNALVEYSFFSRITENFYHNVKGRIAGYGLVKVPDAVKVPWGTDATKKPHDKS